MLKYLLIAALSFSFAISANIDQNQTKKELTWDSSKKPFVSKKEAEYQKYKKKLDAENKKLEEDGFCSCNNNL